MEYAGSILDSIVITSKSSGRIVTADDNQEVIAIISEDEIVIKEGFDVRLVPANRLISPDYLLRYRLG